MRLDQLPQLAPDLVFADGHLPCLSLLGSRFNLSNWRVETFDEGEELQSTLRLEARTFSARTSVVEIPAAIRAYSIELAPALSRQKRRRGDDFIAMPFSRLDC
ncbi:hypothetical protein [Bradyrhizobium archetypum]|uniref:hypothetical protein n=1 Tax=Bradyrhizobium archetypum TaxID=2721160 RepID=UPI004063D9D9